MIDLPCDWKAGFIMDPEQKQRVGYLLDFKGLTMEELQPDIEAFSPYNAEAGWGGIQFTGDGQPKMVKCFGIIESYSFAGGVGDPICISAYISSNNAKHIRAKLQSTLASTVISSMKYWIADFDVENKVWFEAAYPEDTDKGVTGQLNAAGGTDVRISVANEGTRLAPNVDVNVYNMYFEMVPAADNTFVLSFEMVPAADNTFVLSFATAHLKSFKRAWGLKIGETK